MAKLFSAPNLPPVQSTAAQSILQGAQAQAQMYSSLGQALGKVANPYFEKKDEDAQIESLAQDERILNMLYGDRKDARGMSVMPTDFKEVKKDVKKEVKHKSIPVVMPQTKGSLKKRQIVKRSRVPNTGSRSKGLRRSLTKRRQHDLKKGKRISVTKVRKLSNVDVDNIQSRLKSIKGKSTDEIKHELGKQGIKVSGKSPSILKDIYMYSQLCGINIKR